MRVYVGDDDDDVKGDDDKRGEKIETRVRVS